jgi:malonyl CoA-acyl carrier protein transacylase/SAM-dependent methyltransferase
VCHTAGAGRAHFAHRLAVVGATAEQVRERLEAGAVARGEAERAPEVAFLFTGQGAQYAGMGRELYQASPVFRQALERCAGLAAPELDAPLLEALYGGGGGLLERTEYAQVGLFAVEYALTQLWASWGVRPSAVLGHSVGEYAAAVAAGVMSLEDGLRLVAARGRLMQGLPAGGAMAAVLAPEARVRAAIGGQDVWVAAVNGPENVTLSGPREAVERVLGRLEREGMRSQWLRVSHAFHSHLVDPIAEALMREAAEVRFGAPRLDVISGVSGRVCQQGEMSGSEYWWRQARETVRFKDGIEALWALGYRVFVEVGPGTTLLGLGRACAADAEALWLGSVREGQGEWERMLEGVAGLYVRGVEVDWAGFDRPYRRRRVALPTYPFQRRRFWLEDGVSDGQPETSEEPGAIWESVVEAGLRQAAHCPIDLDVRSYASRWRCLDRLTTAFIVNALHDLGAFAKLATPSTPDALLEVCGITPTYRKLLNRWLRRLASEGILSRHDGSFSVAGEVARQPVEPLLDEARELFGGDREILEYVALCGPQLSNILSGKRSPLETLFPGGDFTLAEGLYERCAPSRYFNSLMRAAVESVVRATAHRPRLRLLELGAGTGATTSSLLPVLPAHRTAYHFTDLSELFLNRARRKFEAYPFVHYHVFDMEADPERQEFPLHSCDVVLATNVLHASFDIGGTLERVRSLIAPGGLLLLCEATTPHSWHDVTTALIEGWHQHEDDIRDDQPLLSPEQWQEILDRAGFERTLVLPDAGSPANVLGQHVIVARVDDSAVSRIGGDTLSTWDRDENYEPRPTEEGSRRADGADEAFLLNLAEAPPGERRELLVNFVRMHLRKILRLDGEYPLARSQRLVDLGLDSLMALELRSALTKGLGLSQSLTSTLVFDHPTIDAVCDHLEREVLRQEAGGREPASGPDPLSGAAEALEAMADEEVEILLLNKLKAL